MKKTCHLDRMIANQIFRFDRLVVKDIDNTPVFKVFGHEVLDQEICFFYQDVSSGDHYWDILHKLIEQSVLHKKGIPVVRFADGEYAFYNYDLICNGLYQQAEFTKAIKRVIPLHLEALKTLAELGRFAPLIFPGNMGHEAKGTFSFLRRFKKDSSALTFVEFLFENHIELTGDNYLPFYVVYAYLTSRAFARLVDHKRVCIINSECNTASCIQWFDQLASHPDIVFVEIPDAYVATRWEMMREDVLKRIPSDTELCLVGAGVGALLVCVDVARRFSIPVIDAGHVLNMMNGRDDKSNGPRLYTLRKV